jgi:zinc transport system permease protein
MEFLSYGFIQRALITGALLGVTCAILAVFVVLRRMAFIGVGISHAALGGVAIGLLAGVPPVMAAGAFSVAVAWVIAWITRKGEVSEDTAIGIFFPTAMALGVALISLSQTYRQDLLAYLFGNILSVGPGDLWVLLVLSGISLGVLGLFFKEFLFLGIDEEAARAAGLPTHFLNYLLLTILAVTIVAAMKLVGIILVSAFLVIPAATGQALAGGLGSSLSGCGPLAFLDFVPPFRCLHRALRGRPLLRRLCSRDRQEVLGRVLLGEPMTGGR